MRSPAACAADPRLRPPPLEGCGARAIIAIPDGRLFFSAHDAGAIGEVVPRR